jgi:hypothetical protein
MSVNASTALLGSVIAEKQEECLRLRAALKESEDKRKELEEAAAKREAEADEGEEKAG